MNQVLCNAMPASCSTSLREAFPILRPGGIFLLCESNNPHCPDMLKRLEHTSHAYEIGRGMALAPAGSNVSLRWGMIRDMTLYMSDKDVRRFARHTWYLWGPTIQNAVERFQGEGRIPDSRFIPGALRAVCSPVAGAAQGNITDPYDLCSQAERRGIFRSHLGGLQVATCGPTRLWGDHISRAIHRMRLGVMRVKNLVRGAIS